MDRRERYANEEETLRIAMGALQSRLWTALPGIVQSYNPAKMTVEVLPTINAKVRKVDGTFGSLQMPLLLDCPVLWQGGGGATYTFPIQKGDECLVVFASRCIDAWWSSGAALDPPEVRMHNLSDGFAIVGVRSLPRAYTPPAGKAQLQSDDGSTFVQLDPAGKAVAITAPNGINLNGVTIDSSGNVNCPATVTATTDVIGGGKHLKTHTHNDPQGGVVGPPN
jgi:hypothetical protein